MGDSVTGDPQNSIRATISHFSNGKEMGTHSIELTEDGYRRLSASNRAAGAALAAVAKAWMAVDRNGGELDFFEELLETLCDAKEISGDWLCTICERVRAFNHSDCDSTNFDEWMLGIFKGSDLPKFNLDEFLNVHEKSKAADVRRMFKRFAEYIERGMTQDQISKVTKWGKNDLAELAWFFPAWTANIKDTLASDPAGT